MASRACLGTAALALLLGLAGCAASREARLQEEVERTVDGFSRSLETLGACLEQAPAYAVFPSVGSDPGTRRDAGLLIRSGADPLPCALQRAAGVTTAAGVVYRELVVLTAEDLATLLSTGRLALPAPAEVYDWAVRGSPQDGGTPPGAVTRRMTTPRGGLLFEEPVHGQRIELR